MKCNKCGFDKEKTLKALSIVEGLPSEEEMKEIFGYSSMPFMHDHDCPCKEDGDDGSLYVDCKCKSLNEFVQDIHKRIKGVI